jgi:hypothetical protein
MKAIVQYQDCTVSKTKYQSFLTRIIQNKNCDTGYIKKGRCIFTLRMRESSVWGKNIF